jgi:hypothetical protein
MERLTTNLETERCKHKLMCSAVVEGGKVCELGLFVITLIKQEPEHFVAEWDYKKRNK